MEKLIVLIGCVLATNAAPAQQDEKHLPMLTTGYAKNVFVLTDAVMKTDDTEMQKKLAYDVLQSYRDLEHFLAESYNMLRTSKEASDDEQLLSKKYYELVEVIRHSAVDSSARPDGSVRKEEIIHAAEKIASKLRKMTTGVSDDQISRAMISEVSAHAEASMMLLADLYKAVEKEATSHHRFKRQLGYPLFSPYSNYGFGLGYNNYAGGPYRGFGGYYPAFGGPGFFGGGFGMAFPFWGWIDHHHHHSHHGHHSYHHHHGHHRHHHHSHHGHHHHHSHHRHHSSW